MVWPIYCPAVVLVTALNGNYLTRAQGMWSDKAGVDSFFSGTNPGVGTTAEKDFRFVTPG